MAYDDFVRYLEAKQTVDDRALNRPVWDAMAAYVRGHTRPLRLLEIGAGGGAMLARLGEAGLLAEVDYTAIDADPANVTAARARFAAGSPARSLRLEAADFYDFAAATSEQWDLVVAHAVLDLLALDRALPLLRSLSAPGGAFYFTINFDGATIFEPLVERGLDETIVRLYHRTMDERVTDGLPAGESRTGRRLYHALDGAGAAVTAVGSSDWVVWPRDGAYPADEAYFLHFIVATVGRALAGHPALDAARLAAWLARRHEQIERAELLYIAHQLDYFGFWAP